MVRTLEHYNTKDNYQNITVKVFMILSALLQKSSKTSKAKERS